MSISSQLKQYKNKNIHIVGIGSAEGSAIGEFLVAHKISSITGHDFSSEADFRKAFNNTHLSLKPKERKKSLDHLLNLPIKINFKDRYLEGIEEADIIFVSQVWFKYPQNLPILEKLKDSGVPFKTITNLYFELAPCDIISVTGTNGKTTTARLINSIFEMWAKTAQSLTPHPPLSGGLTNPLFGGLMNPPLDKGGLGGVVSNVYFAGNDRQNIQVLDKLGEMKENDVLILEISSTQLLLNSGISPHIGVITNITPNHIDDHGSFENYIEAKKNLIRYQKEGGWAVLNYDDAETRKIAREFKNNAFLFSAKEELKEGCFVRKIATPHPPLSGGLTNPLFGGLMNPPLDKGGLGGVVVARKNNKETVLFSVDDIKLPGRHNLENASAAASAAYLYGISPEIIKEGISKYTGIKHRLKLLYNINGVKYYDDTQATTPEATIAGIESFNEDIILLAGGDNKGMKYERMAEKINNKVKFLILFPGDASDKIEKSINKDKIDFKKVKNIKEAIEVLKNYYKKNIFLKGDAVVLISPGAAHFYSKFVEGSGKDLKKWILSVSSI